MKWLLILMVSLAMLLPAGELTRLIVWYGETYSWQDAPFWFELTAIWVMYFLVIGICCWRFRT